ncbi:MAG: hypothetical protein ACKOXF_04895, partial [Chitinophagaceae bacterium]
MKLYIRHIVFCIVFFESSYTYAQNFEWLKNFGNKGYCVNSSITMLKDGSSYCFFTFYKPNSNGINDTVKFDGLNYIFKDNLTSNQYHSGIIKLDNSSQVKSFKYLGRYKSGKICADTFNRLYISFNLTDSGNLSLLDSFRLNRISGNSVILKIDTTFKVLALNQFGNLTSNVSKLVLSNNKLQFILNVSNSTILGPSRVVLSSNLNCIFGELDIDSLKFKWYNFLLNNSLNYNFKLLDIVSLKNNIYLVGSRNASNNLNNLIISGDTFYRGGFIVKCDSIGNYIKSKIIFNTDLNNGIHSVETDGEKLYIGGCYSDSIYWKNKWLKTGYVIQNKINFFIGALNENLEPDWIIYPKVFNTLNSNGQGTGFISGIKYNNSFIYCSVRLYDKIIIENATFRNNNQIPILIFKIDKAGNIIWMTEGGDNADVFDIDAVAGKGVLLLGSFSNKLIFGTFSKTANFTDAFLTKLSDNAIIRGAVSSGPYCAGDSIKVPYRKIG